MTITSARIAFSVIAVSISVSPFFTLDWAACMLTTSAPEPLARDLERQQRARAVLEKGVDLGEAREPVVALGAAAIGLDPLLRLVEQEHDLVRLQPVDAGQMPVRENGAARDKGSGAMI